MMTIRESVKLELDSLPDESLYAVREFMLFQKYRAILEESDAAYLNSIPGMTGSIREGIATPLPECIPLSRVWDDV
jgi:hypothetical protein